MHLSHVKVHHTLAPAQRFNAEACPYITAVLNTGTHSTNILKRKVCSDAAHKNKQHWHFSSITGWHCPHRDCRNHRGDATICDLIFSRRCSYSEICLCVCFLVQVPCCFTADATVSGCFVAICGRINWTKIFWKILKVKKTQSTPVMSVRKKKCLGDLVSFSDTICGMPCPPAHYLLPSPATVCLLLCFFCIPHLCVPLPHLLLQPTATVNVFKRSSRCTQFFSCWYDTSYNN